MALNNTDAALIIFAYICNKFLILLEISLPIKDGYHRVKVYVCARACVLISLMSNGFFNALPN